MITKELALTLRPGTELWHSKLTNADGTPMRARVTGKCKTWKTRPDDWSLPLKHGLKNTFAIGTIAGGDETQWSLTDRWAVERHWTEPQP